MVKGMPDTVALHIFYYQESKLCVQEKLPVNQIWGHIVVSQNLRLFTLFQYDKNTWYSDANVFVNQYADQSYELSYELSCDYH